MPKELSGTEHREESQTSSRKRSDLSADKRGKRSLPRHESYVRTRQWYLYIASGIAALVIPYLIGTRTPVSLSASEAGVNKFSGERAFADLRQLVRYGSRPTGSYECEVLAYQAILNRAENIKRDANEIHYIEVEVQRPSGCTKHKLFHDFYYCYQNVSNILVRFGSSNTSRKSILFACNYDTWPNSGGATDNAVSCAIMLELMLVLSHREVQLPYDLIFLFSGAQHVILQGAHGFITAHPWRKYVSMYIALRGAGAGSEELIYATSERSKWLTELYKASVPYLHVKSLIHAIRGSWIFAKEMDYRIFDGFPVEQGMEISAMPNEYLLRSECDAAPLLRHEPIQRTGENILAFLEKIFWGECLDQRCVAAKASSQQLDILGVLTISFYGSSADLFYFIVLLLTPAVISIGIVDDSTQSESGFFILTHCKCSSNQFTDAVKVQSISLAVVFMSTIASFVILREYDMHNYWFGWHYSLVVFYVGPAVLLGLGVHIVRWYYYCDRKTLAERMSNEQAAFTAAVLIFWFIVMIMTSLRLHCTYGMAFPLLILMLRNPILWLTKILRFSCYDVVDVAMAVIPTANHLKPTVKAEVILAALTLCISCPFVLLMSAMVYLSARMKWWAYLGTVWIFTFVTALLSSASAPYKQSLTNPRLNLFFVQHYSVSNCSGNFDSCSEQSFVWLLPMGVRGAADMPKWHWLESGKVTPCIEKDSYCSLPYFFPHKSLHLPNSTVLVRVQEEPFFPKNNRLFVELKEIAVEPEVVEYSLYMRGTDHMTVHLTPLFPWEVFNWTIDVPVQRRNETLFVSLVCIYSPCSWNFTIALKCTSFLEMKR
ncbi:hypothetical protein D918_01662 [Trichuris suis]|nr:hypothetical protein D918_01662 [Trichuris suis]